MTDCSATVGASSDGAVRRLPAREVHRRYPYLLDLQADLLRDLATRIVAPLMPLARLRGKPISRLNPVVAVDGEQYVIVFQELAAFPTNELYDAVASLHARRGELIAAIDLLFTGI